MEGLNVIDWLIGILIIIILVILALAAIRRM
jgi:hypothetical protein